VSIRQFQNLASGKFLPTPEIVSRVFNKEDAANRHLLIRAYFESHLPDVKVHEDLLNYLRMHLSQAIETGKFDWDKMDHHIYSESQLSTLINHSDSFRLWRRLLLFERFRKDDPTIHPDSLKHLLQAELVKSQGNIIRPSSSMFRIPRYGNAAPKVIAKTSEFILKHLENFVSLEGSERQELSFFMQLVTPEMSKLIRQQLHGFLKWAQSHVILDPEHHDGPVVPLVSVVFAKELFEQEMK